MPFKNYRKKVIQPMRPYVPGENMTNIMFGERQELEEGGMIAVNPYDRNDQWYITPDVFNEIYEEVTE